MRADCRREGGVRRPHRQKSKAAEQHRVSAHTAHVVEGLYFARRGSRRALGPGAARRPGASGSLRQTRSACWSYPVGVRSALGAGRGAPVQVGGRGSGNCRDGRLGGPHRSASQRRTCHRHIDGIRDLKRAGAAVSRTPPRRVPVPPGSAFYMSFPPAPTPVGPGTGSTLRSVAARTTRCTGGDQQRMTTTGSWASGNVLTAVLHLMDERWVASLPDRFSHSCRH